MKFCVFELVEPESKAARIIFGEKSPVRSIDAIVSCAASSIFRRTVRTLRAMLTQLVARRAAIFAAIFDAMPTTAARRGYVVDSLEAALWAFHTTDDFRSGCLAAANLGDDADTTAAIYGQLAGVYYGEEGIPTEWRDRLAMKKLECLAGRPAHREVMTSTALPRRRFVTLSV